MVYKSITFYTRIFLFFIALSSCERLEEIIPKAIEGTHSKQYIIKQGQHSSTHSVSKATIAHLKFKATFDSSAIYTTVDKSNQGDINKLYGISDCNSPHHENSARFGWRWMDDNLEIYAYTYINGERNFKYITSVSFDKEFTYELNLAPEQYVFTVNGVTVTMERHCAGTASGYRLYPYFGGDETAPHDITIHIDDLTKS